MIDWSLRIVLVLVELEQGLQRMAQWESQIVRKLLKLPKDHCRDV